MSIIIAAKIKDHVAMICDSAESAGDSVSTLTERERFKIRKLGEVLVGSAGRVRCIRRLVEHPEWFDTGGEPFDKRFIVTNVVSRLFDELARFRMLNTEGDFPENEASIVIAYKDKLFCIDDSFAVREVDKFASVGCTKELIRPYLMDMEEGSEVDVMLKMMRLSSELSASVGPPYRYIETAELEYKSIQE